MKKILIYEYITGGGLSNEDLSSDLMFEAKKILLSIIKSCNLSRNFDYKYFIDYRLKELHSNNSITIYKPSDLYNIRLIKNFDFIIPIIPEINHDLLKYVKFLEKNDIKMIMSDSKTVKICSDKFKFYKYFNNNNLPVIKTFDTTKFYKYYNKYIIKDRFGAGCSYIKIVDKKDIEKYFDKNKVIQPFIKAENYSISVFFSKNSFRFLTLNKQGLTSNMNMIKMKSLTINSKNNYYLIILTLINDIKRIMPGLIGFVGIDILINNNKIYIVEINTRLTTSYVGLYETIGCNMIDLLINHKYIKNVISSRKYNLLNYE